MFLAAARPMNVEWKIRPYLGVLPRVFRALMGGGISNVNLLEPGTHRNKAFSAPRICTVEAGYLARLVKLPAWEMRRAPTCERQFHARLLKISTNLFADEGGEIGSNALHLGLQVRVKRLAVLNRGENVKSVTWHFEATNLGK